MPRQAVTFANHGKSNQKRFGTRRQNLSAHVHSHNHLAQNDAINSGVSYADTALETTAPFCRAARDRSAYAGNSVNASR
jgi:hypothetical protein